MHGYPGVPTHVWQRVGQLRSASSLHKVQTHRHATHAVCNTPCPRQTIAHRLPHSITGLSCPVGRQLPGQGAPTAAAPGALAASSSAAGSMSCASGCSGGLTALTFALCRSGMWLATCDAPALCDLRNDFQKHQRVHHMQVYRKQGPAAQHSAEDRRSVLLVAANLDSADISVA